MTKPPLYGRFLCHDGNTFQGMSRGDFGSPRGWRRDSLLCHVGVDITLSRDGWYLPLRKNVIIGWFLPLQVKCGNYITLKSTFPMRETSNRRQFNSSNCLKVYTTGKSRNTVLFQWDLPFSFSEGTEERYQVFRLTLNFSPGFVKRWGLYHWLRQLLVGTFVFDDPFCFRKPFTLIVY